METGKRTESITPCDIYHVEDSTRHCCEFLMHFLFLLCDHLPCCQYVITPQNKQLIETSVIEIFGVRFFRVFLWISFPWPLIKILTILNFCQNLGLYLQLKVDHSCTDTFSKLFNICQCHLWSFLCDLLLYSTFCRRHRR